MMFLQMNTGPICLIVFGLIRIKMEKKKYTIVLLMLKS